MSYKIDNTDALITPSLVFYEDVIDRNIERALKDVGDVNLLWPHVKTHKTMELVSKLIARGVTKFKCATIAECEMVALAGASQILLAYPAVGPALDRFLNIKNAFPKVKWYALFDSMESLKRMSHKAMALNTHVDYFIDVNVGLNRTGVEASKVVAFAKEALALPNLNLVGLHCYDGHNGISDVNERMQAISKLVDLENNLVAELKKLGVEAMVISGGTPEFPCYRKLSNFYVSPGTMFLQDNGYANAFKDMGYECAACVMTRVISHPNAENFTLDCGTKAIASDPLVRGVIAGLEDKVEIVLQNEEHWVFRMKKGFEHLKPQVGDVVYVIPTHICPTSALYPYALVVKEHKVVGSWQIFARNRKVIF
jgi:D-serine deaminase-like pyridoxal phosphate-dependent protein